MNVFYPRACEVLVKLMMESWYITAELWQQSQTVRDPLLTFCGGHVPQTSVVLEVGPPSCLFIHSRLETWTQTQIHIVSVDCIWVANVFSAVKTSCPSPVWCTYTLYYTLKSIYLKSWSKALFWISLIQISALATALYFCVLYQIEIVLYYIDLLFICKWKRFN